MDTLNVENDEYKKNMRVQLMKNKIVGEIVEVKENTLTIRYLSNTVSGWNINSDFKFIEINKKDCIKLDSGLNSSWEVNLLNFKKNNESTLFNK